MATVRFSKDLINMIQQNARSKMQPAVDRARADKLDNAWGQRIYDTLFGDVQPILTQVPAGWLNETDSMVIRRIAGVHCDITLTLTGKMVWPKMVAETEYVKQYNTYDPFAIELKEHLIWGELVAEFRDKQARVTAAVNRQNEFMTMVAQVTGAYTTLAPALKAWPALWELIPEQYKDKHREIKEREKKEVELTVDLGKLTAMSAAAKFGV